ncbi:MAG: phage portal protein [bacterium]|nr:phage portal protein [bacterium]
MNVSMMDRLRLAWREIRLRAISKLPGEGDSLMTGVSSVISQRNPPPSRQVEDLLRAYSRLPWLRSVVGKIGHATATVPWLLYYETAAPGVALSAKTAAMQKSSQRRRKKMIRAKQYSGELVEVVDHPVLDLLENFNPMMAGLAGRKLTQHHLDLVGEGFWVKERDGVGVVTGLWPIPPFWVRSTPTPNRPVFEIDHSTWQDTIPASEVVWFMDLDPHTPYQRGTGTACALGDELETDEYAAKHSKMEFYNRGIPETLVTAEGMDEGETRRLETDWKQKNRGLFKSLQVYFMNRKIDVKQLGQSFKSLQLIQLREFERNMVIQVFGVPPEVLGIIEKSNRATIDAADYLFSKWVLVPRLELQRAVMQEHLVKEFDERLILDYESPIAEDEERKQKYAQIAPWALKVDEWRIRQGEDPLPDGEGQVHMVPQNLVPTRSLAGAPPAQAPAATPGAPQASAGDAPALPSGPRLVYDQDALEDIEEQLERMA